MWRLPAPFDGMVWSPSTNAGKRNVNVDAFNSLFGGPCLGHSWELLDTRPSTSTAPHEHAPPRSMHVLFAFFDFMTLFGTPLSTPYATLQLHYTSVTGSGPCHGRATSPRPSTPPPTSHPSIPAASCLPPLTTTRSLSCLAASRPPPPSAPRPAPTSPRCGTARSWPAAAPPSRPVWWCWFMREGVGVGGSGGDGWGDRGNSGTA